MSFQAWYKDQGVCVATDFPKILETGEVDSCTTLDFALVVEAEVL